VVVLGSPSLGGSGLTRATIPVQRSPRLGELVVRVGQVPRWEEDHVVAVAKRHELQTSKPDHRGLWERAFGVSHLKNGGKMMLARSFPYLARQLSASGLAGVLSQRVNQVLRVLDLDGDARRIHGDLSWFGQRKALRPAGESIVFPCT
jgi:hypothetical protein